MKRLRILALAAPAAVVMVPAIIVQGVIALRTNYRVNCAADAWISRDFRTWADEIRQTP